MKSSLEKYIKDKLPRSITLRKNNNLYVKKSKVINPKEPPIVLTKVIQVAIKSSQTEAEQKTEFEKSLSEALTEKRQMELQLNDKNFIHKLLQNTTEPTLASVFKNIKLKNKLQEDYYKDLIYFFGDNKKLNSFTIYQIEEFKKFLVNHIKNRDNNSRGTCSNSSINQRLGCLRIILREALKNKLIEDKDLPNSDSRVKDMGVEDLPRKHSQQKFALTKSEQKILLNNTTDKFWNDLFSFAFDTGLRHEGELNKIRPSDVDFGRRTIQFYRPKTDQMSVDVPLTKSAYEILNRRKQNNNLFFPVSVSSIRNFWYKYINLCNFHKKFTPYSTRHTFITRLAEEDTNPKIAMELAGHKCIETTLKFYTHTSGKKLKEAISKLEN